MRLVRMPSRILIYRSAPSDGARALAAALRDVGYDARKISRPRRRLRAGDVLVGWGDCYPLSPDDQRRVKVVVNWLPPTGKLTELQTLAAAGVDTVQVTTARPMDAGWLPRAYNHHSGNDLLTPPARPGFWVKQENIVREFRVHVWNGLSARVALKVPTDDAHPWIRSHTAGWRLDYGQGAHNVRQRHRDAAKAACEALGLTFGAVDVAETAERVFVLEVNRAPGLEGQTTVKYAEKIIALAEGG